VAEKHVLRTVSWLTSKLLVDAGHPAPRVRRRGEVPGRTIEQQGAVIRDSAPRAPGAAWTCQRVVARPGPSPRRNETDGDLVRAQASVRNRLLIELAVTRRSVGAATLSDSPGPGAPAGEDLQRLEDRRGDLGTARYVWTFSTTIRA